MGTMTEMQARIEGLELENAQLRAYKAKPADRITEQDARALVGSAMHHYIFNDHNVNIDDWFDAEGRALLDKLNEGRLSASPADSEGE